MGSAEPTSRANQVAVATRTMAEDAPSRGPRAALVTAEVFCNVTTRRTCRRLYDELELLRTRHSRDLRVLFRNYPGPGIVEELSALEKEAWRRGRFFELQAVLYAAPTLVPSRDLPNILSAAGLPPGAKEAAAENPQNLRSLAQDEVWASRLSVTRAPTVVWNGEGQVNQLDAAGLATAFQNARTRALERASTGIPPLELYASFLDDERRKQVLVQSEFLESRRSQRFGTPPLDLDGPRQLIAQGTAPSVGPTNAPVSVVLYYDAQCYPCSRSHMVLQRLRLAYGDRLRIVFKPFHNFPDNAEALELAQCAQILGGFLPFLDVLLTGRPGPVDPAIACRAAGLDLERTLSLAATGICRERLAREREQAEVLGITKAPTLFVNGLRLDGARSYDDLRLVIDEELRPGLRNYFAE